MCLEEIVFEEAVLTSVLAKLCLENCEYNLLDATVYLIFSWFNNECYEGDEKFPTPCPTPQAFQ